MPHLSVMEGIKKKLAALKVERDDALERAEDADRLRKEAESKFDQVSLVGGVSEYIPVVFRGHLWK